jgi:hypothetical protein
VNVLQPSGIPFPESIFGFGVSRDELNLVVNDGIEDSRMDKVSVDVMDFNPIGVNNGVFSGSIEAPDDRAHGNMQFNVFKPC